MLNGLQVVMHARLFNVRTPGNVNTFNVYFDTVTSVKLLDTEEIVKSIVYVPEDTPISFNFQQADYDSNLFLINGSSFFLICLLQVCIFVVWLIMLPLRCQCMQTKRLKLSKYVFGGGTSRIFIESYADFSLFAILNVALKEWPESGTVNSVKVSNYLSIIVLVFCIAVPLVVAASYACFGKKSESFFLGHRAGNKIPSLLLMLTFFVRRASLSLTLIFW